jgi:16S rRNA (cytidine1402-2'-O)-methyltransferase
MTGAPGSRRTRAARRGALVVVATPIGNLADLSPRAAEVLAAVDVVCCEDTRHTGRLLEHVGVHAKKLLAVHAHNEVEQIGVVLDLLGAGADIALVSDAGTPVISDPGGRLVAAVSDAGFDVRAIPGPSAGLGALVVSGFDVSRFRFEGFLPRKGTERQSRLEEIAASPCPTVVFEAPNRVAKTLGDILAATGADRRVVVARELTKLHEEVFRGRVGEAFARANETEPRGEHVLVVDAAPDRPPRPTADVRAAISRLVAAGVGLRDATTAVEVQLGVAHRVAYAAALELRGAAEAKRTVG